MLDLMTTDQVADLLKVPSATVRYWRHVGTGPVSVKLGRVVRYDRDDVLKFVDASRTTPARRAS